MRDLTKHEVAAMWLYGDDYAISGLSAIEYWRALSPSKRKLVEEMVRDILKAPISAGLYPKGIGA